METYLVISYHPPDLCEKALAYFHEYHEGYLKKFLWGCIDNDHCGYAIIEAESHEHAKMAVPPLARDNVKIIRLTHFDELVVHNA